MWQCFVAWQEVPDLAGLNLSGSSCPFIYFPFRDVFWAKFGTEPLGDL